MVAKSRGLLILVAVIVMFTNLGVPPLWDRDEPRNAGCAREMLERNEFTPRSDLASLGYCLIEMLAGKHIFGGLTKYKDLLEAKRRLPHDPWNR